MGELSDDGYRRKTVDGRLLHQCCVCKKLAPWDDNWKWFGSYKQLEDHGIEGVKPILKFCSDECAKHRAKRSKELEKAMMETADD